MWVYVFMHTRFVVNRTLNDMRTERLQQRTRITQKWLFIAQYKADVTLSMNNIGIGVHRNFSIDRQSWHFACPLQTADGTMQMGVHITLYLSAPQRKWPMLQQQSQKFASFAARFLFTSYKWTWLGHLLQSAVIVSLHYLLQMSSIVTCG